MMNVKFRRLVRTSSSEQYALFDPDRTDANYDPLSIGKIDVHFTDEGIYGTFLLWKRAIADMPPEEVRALVEATLQELTEPMGLPDFYAIEFFCPDLESYQLHSSIETVEEESEQQTSPS